jgi:hypothetical protein
MPGMVFVPKGLNDESDSTELRRSPVTECLDECRIAGHGTRHFAPGLPRLVPSGQNLRGPRESCSLDGHAASPIQDRYRRGFTE